MSGAASAAQVAVCAANPPGVAWTDDEELIFKTRLKRRHEIGQGRRPVTGWMKGEELLAQRGAEHRARALGQPLKSLDELVAEVCCDQPTQQWGLKWTGDFVTSYLIPVRLDGLA